MKSLHQMLKDGEWKTLTQKEAQEMSWSCAIDTSEFKQMRHPPNHRTIRGI